VQYDLPGNNQRTYQQEKLQMTTKHGAELDITKVHTRPGEHRLGL